MRPWAVKSVLALAAAALMATPAAGAAGLPRVATGHRPGPDALYARAPVAPQLQNRPPWRAAPILVSGAQSYRDGEWLYQDQLYDDHGGAGAPDNNNPYGPSGFLFAPVAGTYTYPTDPAFANNGADLVELRVKPLAAATAFRVTLNTLKDPARTAFTIALGSSVGSRPWPHGAGVSSPAQFFLTVHGVSAELVDATTGLPRTPATAVRVDVARRQIVAIVPHLAWNPGKSKVRTTVGVGLWDPAAGSYLKPTTGSATSTTPGGGTPTGVAIVNVGPRLSEPFPEIRNSANYTLGDAAAAAAVQGRWWREKLQADALRTGDASGFYADVDFAKLAAGRRDDSGVPRTGALDRILASAHHPAQGVDPSKICFDLASNFSDGAHCVGRFVGQLQPYALYVPHKRQPSHGWSTTLLLHSLSANYNQYSASNNQSQLGERGTGSLVVTPNGRGPDGFYAGMAEADTFEAWADVARHYRLDSSRATVTGYSMGGFGTYRLLARWPDLFSRGFSVVGIPGTVDDQLQSLRNTPVLAWNASQDELVPVNESEAAQQHLAATGLRFTEDLFTTADHLTLATNDEFTPGVAFLGDRRVDRSPPHVTYVVDPTESSRAARVVADHAYWLAGLRVRNRRTSPTGTLDARSEAFGVGDPAVLGVAQSAGTLNGGAHGPMPFVQRQQNWGRTPRTRRRDRLVVHARNLASATIDLRRARLSCAPQLVVRSDGALTLGLPCASPLRTGRCGRAARLTLPRVLGRRIVAARVSGRGRHTRTIRGHSLRRLVLRRTSRRAFSLRLDLRLAGSRSPRLVVSRRAGACR